MVILALFKKGIIPKKVICFLLMFYGFLLFKVIMNENNCRVARQQKFLWTTQRDWQKVLEYKEGSMIRSLNYYFAMIHETHFILFCLLYLYVLYLLMDINLHQINFRFWIPKLITSTWFIEQKLLYLMIVGIYG